jgi:hypothetical protein
VCFAVEVYSKCLVNFETLSLAHILIQRVSATQVFYAPIIYSFLNIMAQLNYFEARINFFMRKFIFIAGWKRTNSLPSDARQFVMVVKRSQDSGFYSALKTFLEKFLWIYEFLNFADSSISLFEWATDTSLHSWSGDVLCRFHRSATWDDKEGTHSGTRWERKLFT